MAKTAINTRLVLRNDALSAFEASTVPLLKGEMALARRSDGNYEVRIGCADSDKTWSQLSDQGKLVIPADNVEGLTAAIAALSTSYYEASDIAELTGEYVNGDIAVVQKEIADGKAEYTAYRYDTAVSAWKALDGNYSADNVYFSKDMTLTYAFGKNAVPSSGSYTLSCAGKTVAEVINGAFAETKSGTVTQPSFSLAVSGGTGEIGTNYTVPAATFTFSNAGSYQYGPATGITVPATSATVQCTTSGFQQSVSNNAAMTQGSALKTAAGTANAQTYLSAGATYAFTATASYTEGAIPKNNIGGDDPAKRIAAGSSTKTANATFTGYYPAYYAFTSTPTANPTALTATNGNVTAGGVTYTRELNSFARTEFKATGSWYELFYLVPAVKTTKTGWTGIDTSSNLPVARVNGTSEATVTFKDGSTATYKVFAVRNAAAASATTLKMTFG